MWQKIKPYVISIIIALGVGILSSLFTGSNMDIYNDIEKPALAPPSILFPIVWTALYILMGISAAIVYNNRSDDPAAAQKGLTTYAVSLAVNFFWSIIFFNMRAYLFAFVWLILLLYLIISTIIHYHKVSPLAAYLQIPYAVWVTFAGYLNFSIWLLNK